MAAYELSTTSQALLARVAQSDTAALLALSDDKNAVGGGQRAAAVLAGLAMSALYAIDTAEAQADGELRRMARLVDDQSKAAAANMRRTADWLAQAAASYATNIAAIDAAATKFHDAAYPLALLQGWTINPAA